MFGARNETGGGYQCVHFWSVLLWPAPSNFERLAPWTDHIGSIPEILSEYQATGDELANKFTEVDLNPWLELAATLAVVVRAPSLPEQVCTDPDDDKFLACALASGTTLVTSGDKALLATSGFKGITVLTPRQFVDSHLR